uniref:SPK domain-containing protein n=2 Tax=Caenorhabditis tropicalis TaxID=1561998 RepID=A0A1I7U0G5_9PELO
MSSNIYTKMAKWIVDNRWDIVEPIPFATLYNDFKQSQKCNNQLMTMQQGMVHYLKKVEQLELFDITQKIHLMFVLCQPINEAFERQLQNEGTLELEANRRITLFRTNDGSFERKGEPLTRRGRPRKQEEMTAEDTIVDTPLVDVKPDTVEPPVKKEIVEPRVKQEIVEPTMNAMRILESLHSLIFVIHEPLLREFENVVLQELGNQRRRDTNILEIDFVQAIDTGIRILANGATSQQDGEGMMRLNDILKPLTLQLLNIGFSHDSPLVGKMIALTSEVKKIPTRKVKHVLDLLFEAATPAIG